jgi:ribosome-binding factor A
MGNDRIARVNEQLRREVAASLFRVIHQSDVDMAAFTVTKVETSRDLRHANVSVSIRGTESEQARMMQLLGQYRREIQELINKDLVLKYTPVISFRLDNSIAKGHNVLDILSQIAPIRASVEDTGVEEEDSD